MYVSGTSEQMINKWKAEIAALPEKKRRKWKGNLWDKWNVSQRVRYVGEQIIQGTESDPLKYYFEVYKQPNREGGGCWWPVVVHAELAAAAYGPIVLSEYGARLAQAPNMFEEFINIQGETHTGNHYRNHYISVPTAPGEPCRG